LCKDFYTVTLSFSSSNVPSYNVKSDHVYSPCYVTTDIPFDNFVTSHEFTDVKLANIAEYKGSLIFAVSKGDIFSRYIIANGYEIADGSCNQLANE
jgi:hypothetical protein